MKYLWFTFLAVLFFSIPDISNANIIADEYVTDTANIFSEQEEKLLENTIQQIQQKTSAEIAIVTLFSTNDEDIFDAGMKIAEEWKIGKADTDNGLLLLIATQDKKWRFFTGYGLEGALPDALITRIGEEHFKQTFPHQQYFTGVQNAIYDIQGILENDPSIISKYKNNTVPIDNIISLFGNAIFFGFIIASVGRRNTTQKKIFQSLGSILLPILTLAYEIGIFYSIPAIILFLIFSSLSIKNTESSNGWSDWGSSSGFGGNSSFGGGFTGFSGGSFGGGGGGGRW